MSEKDVKLVAESEETPTFRPVGLSFSYVVYSLAGVYYLVYPVLRDTGLYPLYIIGALSLVGSFGVMRMSRWGLWIGLLVYPLQLVAPTFALMAALGTPGLTTNYIVLGFIASVVVLLFLTTLSFLFILDKRKTFK